MNTMIPSQVQFDLSVSDLPARVTQVSSEELILSEGGARLVCNSGLSYRLKWTSGPNKGRVVFTNQVSKGVAADDCRRACPWGNGGRESSTAKVAYGPTGGYYQCVCCKRV